MAVVIRLLCFVLLLSLAGCYSTKHVTHKGASKVSKKAVVYFVRPSDTLYSIGKRFGVDYHLIAKRNYIRKPYRIYLGQRLTIDRWAPRPRMFSSAQIKRAYTPPAKKRAVKKSVRNGSHKSKAGGGYAKGKLLWPVRGKVTSRFGRRGSRMHDGIDIPAKEGTPVRAAASGEVVYSDQRLSGYGKLVIIRHGRNLFTAYAHNQRNLVKKGAKVKAGETIARVGRTGRASGSHLHFEVRQGSTPVDPLAYLPRR